MKENRDDDLELLTRIRDGDGESFGQLYDRTRSWLLSSVIVPRVGRAAAEDVLAETYSVALRKIGSLEWRGGRLVHWLAAIARRKALEHCRARGWDTEALHAVPDLLDLPDDLPLPRRT